MTGAAAWDTAAASLPAGRGADRPGADYDAPKVGRAVLSLFRASCGPLPSPFQAFFLPFPNVVCDFFPGLFSFPRPLPKLFPSLFTAEISGLSCKEWTEARTGVQAKVGRPGQPDVESPAAFLSNKGSSLTVAVSI